MTGNRPKLKPCPCCRSEDVTYCDIKGFRNNIVSTAVICQGCGLQTDNCGTHETAAAIWNRRGELETIQDTIRRVFQHHNATKKLQSAIYQAVGLKFPE